MEESLKGLKRSREIEDLEKERSKQVEDLRKSKSIEIEGLKIDDEDLIKLKKSTEVQDAQNVKDDGRTRSICICGHVDHGKTTLAAAAGIVGGGNRSATINDFMKLREERERGITIVASTVRIKVKMDDGSFFDLVIIDAPGHRDFIKNMITGSAYADCFALCVSAKEGFAAQTIVHLQIIIPLMALKAPNQRILFIVLTQIDAVQYDEMMLEIVKADIEQRLSKYIESGAISSIQFHEVSAGVVTGAVPGASAEEYKEQSSRIRKFIDAVINAPAPIRPVDEPFRMAIDRVVGTNSGMVSLGTIASGFVRANSDKDFELTYFKTNGPRSIPVRITTIGEFGVKVDYAEAGRSVGILLKGTIDYKDSLNHGAVLAVPGSVKLYRGFIGHACLMRQIGKANNPMKSWSEISLVCGANTFTAFVVFLTGLQPEDREEAIKLLNAGARKNRLDPNSIKLKQLLDKSDFPGLKFDDGETIVDAYVRFVSDSVLWTFSIGKTIIAQESKTNVASFQILEVLS